MILILSLASRSVVSMSADDDLRAEIEEAASDSKLLADELADMLARLEADNSRQEAVEAAVEGDDIKVETALQEMLKSIEKLEKVAEEDAEVPELKGTLEEKIEKEEELRKTLETLQTVAKEIDDVKDEKNLKTIDDMTQLLQNINDKIEESVSADLGKTKSGIKSSLHLNGIIDMIKSLEKVTGDLRAMQDNIDDYFDSDISEGDEEGNTKDNTKTTTETSRNDDERKPKTLSEFFKLKSEGSKQEETEEKKQRKGKSYDDGEDSYDDDDYDYGSDDATVEDVVDVKAADVKGQGKDDYQKEYEEECETTEARDKVRVCLPKLQSVEKPVNLYTSQPQDVRHCYDV